jgi:hypothetical protein
MNNPAGRPAVKQISFSEEEVISAFGGVAHGGLENVCRRRHRQLLRALIHIKHPEAQNKKGPEAGPFFIELC